MPSARSHFKGFWLDGEVATFVRDHGKAKKTDLAAGRVNFSAEVNDFLRSLMSKVTPDTIGYALAREKEELRLRMEAIDHQAHELFGTSTIEEWIARARTKERSEADVVETQRSIREDVKGEIFEELRNAWHQRHSNGRAFKRDQDVAWARHRFQNQLRTMAWTPEEFVKRMQQRNRSPEVA